MYYRGVHGVILVCDLCDSDTFHDLETWLRDFLDHSDRDNIQDIAFILLANKVDAYRVKNASENHNPGETSGTESANAKTLKESISLPITEEDLAKWCSA